MRQSLRCKEVWRILSLMAYMGYSYGFVFMFLLYHVDILFVFDYNLVLESNFFWRNPQISNGGLSVGSSRNCGLQVVEVL